MAVVVVVVTPPDQRRDEIGGGDNSVQRNSYLPNAAVLEWTDTKSLDRVLFGR